MIFIKKIFWVNYWLLWAYEGWTIHSKNERFAPKNERLAHLSWATWANHSQSLIWSEGSEQMRDLSEWANLIPNHVKKLIDGKVPIFENRKKWQSLHPKSPECTVQYCRYQIIQVKNSSWSLHFCTCRWRSASNYSFFLLTEGIIIIYGRSLCFGKVADN